MDRIEEMRIFLEQQTSRITEYDEQLVRRMIEKIVVFPDRIEITFKSEQVLHLKDNKTYKFAPCSNAGCFCRS